MTESKHAAAHVEWIVHDHSMASLTKGGDLMSPILSIGPCESCAKRGREKGWRWGVCCTPTKDDADLIAEAFNVTHETGRTPRQLADRVKELEAVLQETNDVLLSFPVPPEPWDNVVASRMLLLSKGIHAAIAKAGGA
jgi:hypothetical protein